MIILPAIDIIDKKPVRLYQGDYDQKEIVGSSVLELARNFEKTGAEYIHLVDLDGAKAGMRVNQEVILHTPYPSRWKSAAASGRWPRSKAIWNTVSTA